MRRLIPLLLLFSLIGCDRKPEMAKVAGFWPGKFSVESGGSASDFELKGYLQLYLNNNSFKMEMSTVNQTFTATGKWSIKGDRVHVQGDTFTFDNPTDEDQKALSIKLVTPEQVRATLGGGLVFVASEDRKSLMGLKTSFGPVLGHFEFQRALAQ